MPQPYNDLQLTYSSNAQGQIVVDLVRDQVGDLATVGGTPLLAQDIVRYLTTPKGLDPFNLEWGSAIAGAVGQASEPTSTYEAAVHECEAYFLARQESDAQQGTRPLSALLERFDGIAATTPRPGAIVLSFVAVTRARTTAPILISYGTGTASGLPR